MKVRLETGGRWNSRGVPVIYTSSTKSLAALESLVHLNPPVLFKYVVIRITFDEALLEIVRLKCFLRTGGSNCRHRPPRPLVMSGCGKRSAVLALPSVIISGEPNYLINPGHPDFKRISIGKPQRFAFDPRLFT